LTIIIPANSAADTAYEVANSCRFNDNDSAYMAKDTSDAGTDQRRTWTFSTWFKIGNPGLESVIFCSTATPASDHLYIRLKSDGTMRFLDLQGGSNVCNLVTNRKFRDVGAWYHLVIRADTTQSTASDRLRIYINGGDQETFGTEDTFDEDQVTNTGLASGEYFIGVNQVETGAFWDGYLAETYFCSGQSYAPTQFGEFNSDSPTIWQPIDASGSTFGTNGFYLDYEASDNLGNDANGGTDFTETNLAATDQTTDTPTNNFCTLNSLDNYYASYTFSEGNCKIDGTPSPTTYRTGTMGVASGKWYWEVNITAAPASNASRIGFTSVVSTSTTHILGSDIYGWAQNGNNGNIEGQASQSGSAASTSYGNSHTTDDIIGIALNLDDDEVKFYKNGTVENSGTAFQINKANAPNGFFFPAIGEASTSNSITAIANFGNPAWALSSAVNDENGYGNFEYSVPSGFLALCTKNLGSDGG